MRTWISVQMQEHPVLPEKVVIPPGSKSKSQTAKERFETRAIYVKRHRLSGVDFATPAEFAAGVRLWSR